MTTKILIVDDSATVRQQVRIALEQAGFEVLEAVDGVDGFEQIRANANLSAVICDVNMPNMDGLELLEKLAASKIDVPIVMLTTEGQPASIQRAKRAGARGWIVKPFKADLLIAAMEKLTRAA